MIGDVDQRIPHSVAPVSGRVQDCPTLYDSGQYRAQCPVARSSRNNGCNLYKHGDLACSSIEMVKSYQLNTRCVCVSVCGLEHATSISMYPLT